MELTDEETQFANLSIRPGKDSPWGNWKEVGEKIRLRVNEDLAHSLGRYLEDVARDREGALEEFFVHRVDTHAYWFCFLVPGLIGPDELQETLESTFLEELRAITLKCDLPEIRWKRLRLRVLACIARWKGQAFERAWTWNREPKRNLVSDIAHAEDSVGGPRRSDPDHKTDVDGTRAESPVPTVDPRSSFGERPVSVPNSEDDLSSMTSKSDQKRVIGQNIDDLRQECGWTIEQLAEQIGMDRTSVADHILKRVIPRIPNLKIYADAFSKRLGRAIRVGDLKKQ